ncbi:MAG: hypothetical protein IKO78_02535 [Bacilli bacterium]|nr:hypothetical protein [Bacilli bacterium]
MSEDLIITDDELNTLLNNLDLKFIAQKLKIENVDKSIITLLKIVKNLQQENKQLKRDKNIMQNYLQLIIDIGYDYDGYNDVENLKALIDELCKYALYGIKLDDKLIISSSCEKYYNILGEEILGGKENE